MTPHSKLCKQITEWLASIGAYYVTHHNSGGYGRKGVPDILACVRGKFVAIEVKVAPDKPSPWQMRELKACQEAGGISVVAYSLEELMFQIWPEAAGVERGVINTPSIQRCNMCRRLLNDKAEPVLSRDCGGDCWGCIGEIEATAGYEPSVREYNKEVRAGIRKGPLITRHVSLPPT